ncbi:MAG: ImmA/IrrE family metallo-endopeptidase, partial [Bilifractor sp.]
MIDNPIRAANYAYHKYNTRNPYEIIDAKHIYLKHTDRFQHLLGYFKGMNGIRTICLNQKASDQDQLEAAGHELGHCYLHYAGG